MKKCQIYITAVHMLLLCVPVLCDTWKLFKKMENVDRQTCNDSDSVFTKIQTFDKSACLFECVTRYNCQSVFHGQYTGDCIGCVASFNISNQPTGLVDNLQYYWQPNCPDGWSNFANSCYLITENRMDFLTGVATCQSLNARAVIIDTEEENNYLKTLINSTIENKDEEFGFIVGFTDMYSEGIWVEYGTYNQMTFHEWGNGEPSGFLQENCVALHVETNFKWVDIACDWNLRIICERNY